MDIGFDQAAPAVSDPEQKLSAQGCLAVILVSLVCELLTWTVGAVLFLALLWVVSLVCQQA